MKFGGVGVLDLVIILLVIAVIVAVVVLRQHGILGGGSNIQGAGAVHVQNAPVFCPKCGSQLPAGAAFCGKCGAQLGECVAGRMQAASAAPGLVGGGAAGFTPVGIAGRIAAVIAGICMFMPWVGLSSSISNAYNDFAGFLSGSTGVSLGSMRDYAIFELRDAIKALSYLDSSFWDLYTLFLLMWMAALALLAIGFVVSLLGKRKGGLLAFGCLCAAAVAALWAMLVMYINSSNHMELLNVGGGCIGAIVLGILAFVLMLVSRPKTA